MRFSRCGGLKNYEGKPLLPRKASFFQLGWMIENKYSRSCRLWTSRKGYLPMCKPLQACVSGYGLNGNHFWGRWPTHTGDYKKKRLSMVSLSTKTEQERLAVKYWYRKKHDGRENRIIAHYLDSRRSTKNFGHKTKNKRSP